MRKISISIVVFFVFIFLTSCSNNALDEQIYESYSSKTLSETETVNDSINVLEQMGETTEEIYQFIEYSPQVPTVIIHNSDNDGYIENTISVEGNVFEDLNDAIDLIQTSNSETIDSFDEEELRYVADRYYLERSDSFLFSFCHDLRIGVGESVDMTSYFQGYTYRTDGTRVYINDIVRPDKWDDFCNAAESFITYKYGDIFEDAYYAIDIEDVFYQLRNLDEEQWALDTSSFVFYYLYQVESFAYDKHCAINIPYTYVQDYMDPQYLPGDSVMIGAYDNFTYNFSRNHMLTTVLGSYNLREYGTGRDFSCLYLNSSKYTYDNSELSERGFGLYVRDEAGRSYLVIIQNTQNGYDEAADNIKLFDISDGVWELIYTASFCDDENAMDAIDRFSNIDYVLELTETRPSYEV